MDLGAFSISLAVKDLSVSTEFYEKLGFEAMGGGEKWRMMKCGEKVIGLFEGMFPSNIITFNPGWSQSAEGVDPFMDVREVQRQLKASGLELDSEADESSTGPASLTLKDPDGNVILIDQHR